MRWQLLQNTDVLHQGKDRENLNVLNFQPPCITGRFDTSRCNLAKKERRIFTQNVFLVHAQSTLEVNEMCNFTASVRIEMTCSETTLYRKRPVSFA